MSAPDIETLFEPEDLDPELEAYRHSIDGISGEGMDVVRHPLVYSVPYAPIHNKPLNAQLQFKRKAIAELEAEGRWDQRVWLYERPHRFRAMLDARRHVASEKFWRIAGEVWTDCENVWQNERGWRALFADHDDPRAKRFFMTCEERDAFDLLPYVLTVYRGYSIAGRSRGLSWTLEEERAAWFARRLARRGETPRIAAGTIARADAFATVTRRGEAEVVVRSGAAVSVARRYPAPPKES